MLLTITTTHSPATDLGYLLHKHPARMQTFELSFGRAHVFYPEAGSDRCTAADDSLALRPCVNDRPYVGSSFLSVAIAEVFGTALGGRCKERPRLADTPLPLQARIAVLPCRGGEPLLRRLFEPLAYRVSAQQYPLDERFPEWGDRDCFTVTLTTTIRLRDLLTHLYMLVPVPDDEKHCWEGDDEVAKLLQRGEGWRAQHPERELIADRYLKHQHHLTRSTLAQLDGEEHVAVGAAEAQLGEEGVKVEASIGLQQRRLEAVRAALRDRGGSRVLDLGCGEGRLLAPLLQDQGFTLHSANASGPSRARCCTATNGLSAMMRRCLSRSPSI
jgi:3' terminal RNA ribose 2'-O-methyltransferase Hen1